MNVRARTLPHASAFSRASVVLPVVCLAAVFVVKAVALAELDHHPLLQPAAGLDPAYYVDLARQVASGRDAPVGQAHFVSPLYVYFLAAVFAVTGGSLTAAKLVQIALGTIGVWLVWQTARAWFGRRAAWIASALTALCGFLTFCEVTLLQAALDPFLTAAALFLVARAWQTGRTVGFVAAGFTVGVFALNRPNVLPYAALLPVAALLLDGGRGVVDRQRVSSAANGQSAASPFGARVVRALALAFGVCAAIAPVAIRNARACGEWVPISSHGGLNFYIGNNPAADGTYHAVPGITPSIEGQARDAQRVAGAAIGRQLGPVEVSDYFSARAWDWIRASPGSALALFARKIAYVFSAAWITLNYSYPYYRGEEPNVLRLLFVGPWLLIPLGLVGLFLSRPAARPGYIAWALFVPAYAVAVAAFFVSDRYRLPLLLPFAVGAGATLDWVARLAGAHRVREAALPAVAVLVLAALVNWPLGLDDGAEAERTQMLLYEVDHHEDPAAMSLLQRAEPRSRDRAGLLYTVATAYLQRHDPGRAWPLLQRAAEAAPGRSDVALALAQALLDANRPADAIVPLQQALTAGERPDLVALDLARAYAATGHRDDARRALRTIRDPGRLDAALQFAAGRLALDLGDAATAEPFLRRASREASPGNAGAFEALGLALTLLGRGEDAAAAFESACRLDPGNATAHLNLAALYAESGRFADARRHAQEALRLRPEYTQARDLLKAIDRAGKGRPAGR